MTVALDASYSLGREPSGVAVYSSQIIRALAATAPDTRFLLCYRANRFLRSFASPLPAVNCSRRLLEEFACFLFEARVALFHGLNQRLPGCSFRRTVTTFHDLFVMTGDYSTAAFRRRFTALARDAANRSDHLIAVSGFTANQVAQHLGYPRENITVVPHGLTAIPNFPADELQAFRREQGLEAAFLLHVGAIQKRKNIARLVEAFEGIDPPCLLVLAGSAGYGADAILERIEASPARDRVRRLGYVDAERLAKLYRTAAALVFPSLDEGFGIPVLEAMSAGLPVVTSGRSALTEVAGQAALLVNPDEPESIRAAMIEVLSDAGLREKLIQAGHERAAEFSWQRAARETLEVYRRLA